MDDARIAVAGLSELRTRLLALPVKVQKKALTKAVRAGAQNVRAQAKANAPFRSGTTKANVVAKPGARRYQGGADVRYIVGVRHGRTNTNPTDRRGKKRTVTKYDKAGRDPFYFRFQELGFTAVGRRNPAKRAERANRRASAPTYGRWIPGKKFLQNALTSTATRVTEKISSVLASEIEAIV